MADLTIVDIEVQLANWLFRRYFVPGSPYHVSAVGVANKVYLRVNQPINIDKINEHLQRKISLAALSAHNGLTIAISVDIDNLEIVTLGRAVESLKSRGLPVVVSFSGDKGYHFTFFLEKPVPLPVAQQVSHQIKDTLNNCNVTYCKISPSPEGNGGDCVALPLGVHPETGKYCYFLDDALNPVNDAFSFIQTIKTLESGQGTRTVTTINKDTGEILTNYPTVLSKRQCINRLWNEGLQASSTRHSATMVIANAVCATNLIAGSEKENATFEWLKRTFEQTKAKGFIHSNTDLQTALNDARSQIARYARYGTFAQKCYNQLFKPAMTSACTDEFKCKLEQNNGSADYKLMRTMGVFAAQNARPKGLGKSAMAVYEAIESIVQDYPSFTLNGKQIFTLSIQELIPLSSCCRTTVINTRKKLLQVGLLINIPKETIPIEIINKNPRYVEYYHLPEIDGVLIQAVVEKIREGV